MRNTRKRLPCERLRSNGVAFTFLTNGRIVGYSYKAQIDPAAPVSLVVGRKRVRGSVAGLVLVCPGCMAE